MRDADPASRHAAVPPPPKLPEPQSPAAQEVLDGVPSTSEVVAGAQSAEDIVDEQPTVDELLGDQRTR